MTDLDRQQIIEIFSSDSEENLRTMEEALILLEERPDNDETLQTIFRVAHTLKGDAATLGFTRLAEFAHVCESLLDRLRRRVIRATPALISILLEATDMSARLVRAAVAQSEEIPEGMESVLQRLQNPVEQKERDTHQADSKGADALTSHQERNHTIRVNIDKLDRLLDLAGEIAVSRGRFEQAIGTENRHLLIDLLRESDSLHLELQELVTKIRLIPIGPTFWQFNRLVRDLSLSQGKMARLTVEGEDAEIDMKVIEQLKAPLTHMVRNALDHGIESPDERMASGKHPCGQIRLSAHHEGGSVFIHVEDDGRGFDREKMIERARTLGIIKNEDPTPSSEEIYRWIFLPGFTTSDTVTEVSGRGVGMDVVKRNIEELRGTIDVRSEKGKGVRVIIRLPLTLALIEGFAVGVEEETFIIPMDCVVECMSMMSDSQPDEVTGLINIRGELLPYVRLRRILRTAKAQQGREHAVVVQHGREKVAIVVDSLQGQTQVVIKPIGPVFRDVRGLAGSAILANGRIALILDVQAMLSRVIDRDLLSVVE